MGIERIGVVGAGQMGNGIAQVAAAAGYAVICSDISEASLAKGKKTVADSLGRLVKKEKLSGPEADAILGRITWTTQLADL
ncbi:MAG TPA: 3-hydroxyacyl-CoA dehydrogenase NAD-binding domain-containing protein, partial [Myxococcota bacterium]|nr:3-hydroxyacyl-CoA dehydrogenase NAD-binding domain-containing protein [Myxococcota bacterium]